jgi:hypothetical protein
MDNPRPLVPLTSGTIESVGVGRGDDGNVDTVYVDMKSGSSEGCFRCVFTAGAIIIFEQTESMTVLKF